MEEGALRSHGVTVIEYESDYSGAVKSGRKLSEQDPYSYFGGRRKFRKICFSDTQWRQNG